MHVSPETLIDVVAARHPKTVLLDIGGVFLKFDHRRTYSYLEKLGVQKSTADQFFLMESYKNFSRGFISPYQFRNAVRNALSLPTLHIDQMRAAHDRHIIGVVPGMVNILNDLDSRYQVAFVTNTNPWQTERQKALINLNAYPVFASNELGVLKTDRPRRSTRQQSFITHVIHTLHISPAETLLIDDSKENIDEAARHDIAGLWFTQG